MMKLRLFKGMMLALAMVCSAATVNAADDTMSFNIAKGSAQMGTLRGRVTDSSDQFLSGAAVYIKELNRGAVCDANGFYTIQSVQNGTVTVEVSYVGYNVASKQVEVKANETSVLDIKMDASTTIDNVVVTSVMQGQARALNTQKTALNMIDVISQDEASKYPDVNIGDALKRISGISVQYDQGEARFGQVRGTPADMSSVTINGDRIPSAEGETRSVQLDLIPTDMIQTIEVSKVITPDMEGDAIGGSINLVTKNSPSKRTINATVGSGYDMVSERAQVNLGVTYGDKVTDKFGYMLSASYQNNPIGSDDTEFEWDLNDAGEQYIKEMQVRQYYVQRERQSYSASMNYAFNKNHKIDFKGLYNRRNDWENRYKTKIKIKDDGSIEESAVETKAGTPDQKYGRLEQQQTMNFQLGGEHILNKLQMDWGASFSAASEDRPNETYIAYASKKVPGTVNWDMSDRQQPYITNAAELGTLSAIMANKGELDELSVSQQEIQEYDYGGQLNFKYDLSNGEYSTSFKFGAKFTAKEKSVDVYTYEYKDALVDYEGFVADALDNTLIADRKGYMPGEGYNFGREFTTREFVGDLNFKDATVFNQDDVEDKLSERAGNYDATENVTAAYLRVDQQLGDELSMMAGFRMEHTAVSNNGYKFIDEDDMLEATKTEKSSYTNVLPSVLFKWDPNSDLKVRASYTNSIARPKYSDLVNNIITDKDEKIKFGNPDLKASLSHNVDLSADYYFKSIGLVRGGVFYKKINDFIVDDRSGSGDKYGAHNYEEWKKPVNGGNANLIGFEANFSRDLSFITPSLSCMGIAGTYTYTHTRVTDFNIEGRENEKDMKLPGSPENTANASLYFKKGGLTTRVSYNYASAFVDEVGKSAFEDRYYDAAQYLDLNISYNFKKNYTFYADATNLLNQPLRYYQGTKDNTMQAEYYGPRFNAGFKVSF